MVGVMTAIALLQSAGAAALVMQVLPIVAIGAIFYFLVVAPANKQRRKTQEMLSGLKKGDRVITTGGIYGTIQGVESDVVFLKVAENVKVRLARSAITSVVTGDAAE
jgi:preprotein translocase subunit YajC